MKELREGIYLHYGEKKVVPICPVCGDFLTRYHRPPRGCYNYTGKEPPARQLTFQRPSAYLVQDPDGDWWLFPWAYNDDEIDVHNVRYVAYPPDAIRAYLTTAYDLRDEIETFAFHLEETLSEMEEE